MRPGFICTHVLSETDRLKLGSPVRVVQHDAPVEEGDSGWVLTCGSGQPHSNDELRIVDLDRYIDQDPALQELRATLPEGQVAWRSAPGQPWVIEAIRDEAA